MSGATAAALHDALTDVAGLVRKALESRRLRFENVRLKRQLRSSHRIETINCD